MFKYHCDNKNYQKNEKGGNLSRFFFISSCTTFLRIFFKFYRLHPHKGQKYFQEI